MRVLTRRRLAITLYVVVAVLVAAYVTGRFMAISPGFPDPAGFSSAEIYVYDDDDFSGRTSPLSAEEEGTLRKALSAIRPIGPGVDARSLVSQARWPGEMFLLTLGDGRTITVKDVYQHVLIGVRRPCMGGKGVARKRLFLRVAPRALSGDSRQSVRRAITAMCVPGTPGSARS